MRDKMTKRLRGNLLLLLTAFIWGVAFVAQSEGMKYVGPFTFTAIRSYLGGTALLVFLGIRRLLKKRQNNNVPGIREAKEAENRTEESAKERRLFWHRYHGKVKCGNSRTIKVVYPLKICYDKGKINKHGFRR